MNLTAEEFSEKFYYFLLILWSVITTLTTETSLSDEILTLSSIYGILRLVIYGLLVVRLIIYIPRYTLQQFCLILFMLFLIFITFLHAHYDFLYPAYLFVLSSYQVNLKKALHKTLNAEILLIILVILLALMGIIPNNIIYRHSEKRMALGFSHANTLGSVLLTITLLSFYLFHDNNQTRVYITIFFSFLITRFVADSRTGSILIFSILIVQMMYTFSQLMINNSVQLREREHLIHKILNHAEILFLLIIVINFVCVLGNLKYDFTDATFNARFFSAYNYIKHYSLNLFGHELYFGISDNRIYPDWNMKNSLATLDNAYTFLLIGFGIVGMVTFIIFYFARIKLAVKRDEYALIIVFLIYAIGGIMETALIRFSYNYFLLLFADLIWNKEEQS